MSSWLVTGGAGFIGSHLCRALVAKGDVVRVLDDYCVARRGAVLPPEVVVTVGDVTNQRLVREAVDGVDGCYHLAALASVQRSDHLQTFKTNAGGLVTLLDAASDAINPPPVVYASSAAVYGEANHKVREAAYPKPISAYGAEKLSCELMAGVVGKGEPTGLRLFNVYGHGCHGVVAKFRDCIARGVPVEICGDGRQTRDFVHVSDAVAALLAAMAVEWVGALNVCTGVATTVLGLANMMAMAMGKPLNVRHVAERKGDIRHSSGSPELSRRVLGLGEPIALQDGLTAYLQPAT